MIYLSLEEIVKLLYTDILISKPETLAEKCRNLGMKEDKFVDLNILGTLPEFDNGFAFIYETDNKVNARLEIIDKDGIIMQAGIQIIYPISVFSSKSTKHFKYLTNKLNEIYGAAMPMDMPGTKILNYGNENSVCYISISTVNKKKCITLKFGNRAFW